MSIVERSIIMTTKEGIKDVENFEKINSQLNGLHEEISVLSKKSPDAQMNIFKLEYVNTILKEANDILGENYLPLKTFEQFSVEALPTNSDVVFILSQYLNCMEQLRTENIKYDYGWYWVLNGKITSIQTYPPKKLQK